MNKKDLDELDKSIGEKKLSLSQAIRNEEKFNDPLKANQDMQDKPSREIKEMKIKKFNRDKGCERGQHLFLEEP